MSPPVVDLDLKPADVAELSSVDALAQFFTKLGYNTDTRAPLTPEAVGLTGDTAAAVRDIELLSVDRDEELRVVFARLRSLTAKSRNDLARVLGKSITDHLLVLTSDFSTLEFVLLQKRRRELRGPAKGVGVEVVPLTIAIDRKSPSNKELKALRRFTWTSRDGLEQYDKLRSTFEAAAFTEDYFCNRALFADHYLLTRLREGTAWKENPSPVFHAVRGLWTDPRGRWLNEGEPIVRDELFEPLFDLLGFEATVNKPAKDGEIKPDYLLTSKSGDGKTAAFVYAWDRWLDGPDFNLDADTPDENPGACVVSALEEGIADWIIVTNGRQWRLYSRNAHSRATNFYEVDLADVLLNSGDTDPNEAFRYWWLFFRSQAFGSRTDGQTGCWLDSIAEESRDYAKALGERLKSRVFVEIFPHLAEGFMADRKQRIGNKKPPTDEELRDTFEATLTLLYRILFLLYAEARDLLPIREAPYRDASLRNIKYEIADKGGIAESEAPDRLRKAYSATEHSLYDRLLRLCAAMDKGDPALNVPTYNGGLFITSPSPVPGGGARGGGALSPPPEGEGQGGGNSSTRNDTREHRIARFLASHKVPDRYLALAIDRLARDPDDKTFSLVAIDYKSLEVRHLGSIYEGLLEFKLKIAEDDLTTATEKKKEKYIPLGKAKPKRGKAPVAIVRKGEVYLSNDKAERKASGSYYTPDPIVEYIVEHTVGPVLAEKLEKLRPEFRKVRKTFDNELAKLKVPPIPGDVTSGKLTEREFAGEKTYKAHQALVEQLFEFRTLDPAMGSGHFLVEAVDYITDRLLAFLNQFPVNPVTFMLERTRKNILAALTEQGVAVDPDKLTEVNLLKRHVLKRCIYGVDLNPMAVELAKVSLWLDAFTIGAPLSFLDHHLRCGNSLIGATFEDLKTATKGQLFGIDYQPLLRAIRHVLQVNQMADATAAEVKQSASEYGEARDQLSGYKVVLDLLVAKHFDVPDAPELLTRGGSELDLASRSRFIKSLDDVNELATIERVEQIATQPHLRFFHWEIEFPEVFFGFADADGRQLKDKNEIVAGSAGFDAVVGNPPYSGHKGDFDARPLSLFFKVCQRYPNLATAFVERAVSTLRQVGSLGLIIPKSIQYVDAWVDCRELLTSQNNLIRLADVSQAFDDVLLEQSVVIAEKTDAQPAYIGEFLVNGCGFIGIPIQASVPLATGCLPASIDERSLKLLSKLLKLGPRLSEIAATSQAFGYQEFLNRKVTGDMIPIYRGKHIRPMRIDPAEDLMDRAFLIKADSDELKDKCREMLAPKVVSQNIVAHVTSPKPRVWVISSADHDGILCLNTISTTIMRDLSFPIDYIAAILNSSLASWYYTEFVFCRAIRTMHFDNYYAGKLPIPIVTSHLYQFTELTNCAPHWRSRAERQGAIDEAVFDAYELDTTEREFIYEYCYGTSELTAVLSGF